MGRHILPVRLGQPSSSKLAESLTGSTAMAAEWRRERRVAKERVFGEGKGRKVMERKGVEVAEFI